MGETYRGWDISVEYLGHYAATGPNYEAWTEGEGEWSDNGQVVYASTRPGIIEEIDIWIEEHAPECAASPLPSGNHQVDTSMESGPNNCFFCEAPMGGARA